MAPPFASALTPLLADPHAARLVAEGAFQKAKVHLRRNAVLLAELRRAAELCQVSREYSLHLKWAESLSETGDARPSASRDELKRLATKAIREDPNLAFGFFVLGQIALQEEDPKLSIRLLRHALRLDPDLVDAERHLRLANLRDANKSVGPATTDPPESAPQGAPASEEPEAAAPSTESPPSPDASSAGPTPRRGPVRLLLTLLALALFVAGVAVGSMWPRP